MLYRIQVTCTNKLCDYEGTKDVTDRRLKGKMVCPSCGFKTLEQKNELKESLRICPKHNTGGGPCTCQAIPMKHGKTCSDFLAQRDMNGAVVVGHCINENNPMKTVGNCHSIHCPRYWPQEAINEYNWEL